jgi:hypothetical protein
MNGQPIEGAIFLDNTQEKIEQVKAACPAITSIHVADSAHGSRHLEPNKTLRRKPGDQLEIRVNAGINASTIRRIASWTRRHRQGRRVALFDWGCTITQFKGGRPQDSSEETLTTICGGPARLAALRRMFNGLYKAGVEVVLLTNNTTTHRPVFKQLVRRLLGPGRPYKIIASRLTAAGHKGRALQKLGAFRGLCKMTRKMTRKDR